MRITGKNAHRISALQCGDLGRWLVLIWGREGIWGAVCLGLGLIGNGLVWYGMIPTASRSVWLVSTVHYHAAGRNHYTVSCHILYCIKCTIIHLISPSFTDSHSSPTEHLILLWPLWLLLVGVSGNLCLLEIPVTKFLSGDLYWPFPIYSNYWKIRPDWYQGHAVTVHQFTLQLPGPGVLW